MKHIKLTLTILITVLLQATVSFSQGIAVNDDGSDADASSILDVKSAAGTQGFLLPRLTEAQKNAITSPATSLLIYQTDGTTGFYFYDGSSWTPVSSKIKSYTTVADAEAVSGTDNELCYVDETETFYKYEVTGSSYTDDNKYVLSTNDGGNTRWIGVAGQYNLGVLSLAPIIHLDATSGSATITDLNKIYYIEAAVSTTTITIPDATPANEGWFLRLYKCSGKGEIQIQTTGGQLIDNVTPAVIYHTGKGFYIKADLHDTPQWLKIQDSRTYVPIVINTGADYGATENWDFDFLKVNTNSGDINVTLPPDISAFPEGSTRMFFNTGNNLLYGIPNGNVIDGSTETRVIAPGGYIELQKIDGVIKIVREKNLSIKKTAEDINYLECWLDASQLSGTDGSSLTTWNDLSGKGNNFTAVNAPTLQTDKQNGKNIVNFDGSNDVMSAGDVELFDNTRGFTIVAVIRPKDTKRMAILSKYLTSPNGREFAFGNRDNFLFEDLDWNSYTGAVINMGLDEFQIAEFVWSPGNPFQLFINGVLQTSGNISVNDITDGAGNLKLGCGDYTPVGFWNGDIAELMIYSTAVSSSNRKYLRDNLAAKWNIDEIIIADGGAKYWQRDGNTNTLRPDVPDDNLDLGTGTVTGSNFIFNTGGTATPSVRQVVGTEEAVTMDNISVQLSTGTYHNLQLKTLTGSFDGNCSANGIFSGVNNTGSTNAVIYTTTYTSLISNTWNFALGGDYVVYMLNDTDNNLWYKITIQIGDNWTNNLIMIERLY